MMQVAMRRQRVMAGLMRQPAPRIKRPCIASAASRSNDDRRLRAPVTRICRFLVIAFAVAYALALGLLAIGTFGLFGQERDPLSGVFLIPLGVPWVFLLDPVPDALKPWTAMAAPALNLALLWALCRAIAGRRPAAKGD
jgi:hypothetical protein